MSKFKISHGKGFGITLYNGLTVSVQFGRGNYCEHHNDMHNWDVPEKGESFDAETAIINESNDFVRVNGEVVQGWQSPDQVAMLISAAARQKSGVKFITIRKEKYRRHE